MAALSCPKFGQRSGHFTTMKYKNNKSITHGNWKGNKAF